MEKTETLLVSVIICSFSIRRLKDLMDATLSVLKQTYDNVEILIVVDGNRELYEKLVKFYNNSGEVSQGYNKKLKLILNRRNLGLSESRNRAIKEAKGNIIAFLDDDAVADKNWIENMLFAYKHFNAIGVGGKILPLWMSDKPDFLPDELLWIVTVTYRGFPENVAGFRNTFGSNISFKREVFEKIGSFSRTLGRKGESQMQAEETEFCIRASTILKENTVYNPEAIIYHKVYPEKISLRFIVKRAFWQGYSKAALNALYKSNVLSTESKYFKQLLFEFYPSSLRKLMFEPLKTLKQLLVTTVVIVMVGSGYLYYFLS